MKKGHTRGYTIYWINPEFAKTGYTKYTTTALWRAEELFRRDYDESYHISFIAY